MKFSIDEAREMAELTERIVANLETIDQSVFNCDDLEEWAMRSSVIVSNLSLINDDGNDLDQLLEETNTIARNLARIAEAQ